jgi:hypothetical protein
MISRIVPRSPAGSSASESSGSLRSGRRPALLGIASLSLLTDMIDSSILLPVIFQFGICMGLFHGDPTISSS